MKRLLILGAVLMAAGCQTKTVEEMSYSERRDLASQIANRCYAQGVRPGSAEYVQCSRVEVQREVATRRRRAAVEDAMRAAPDGPRMCQGFGTSMVCF